MIYDDDAGGGVLLVPSVCRARLISLAAPFPGYSRDVPHCNWEPRGAADSQTAGGDQPLARPAKQWKER